ncbi:MAG: hypothetical protein JJU36_07710 [Phycisphaeraceae bacterium]|nr:hypothetical protein [Phycisphaeraceae bacterium]
MNADGTSGRSTTIRRTARHVLLCLCAVAVAVVLIPDWRVHADAGATTPERRAAGSGASTDSPEAPAREGRANTAAPDGERVPAARSQPPPRPRVPADSRPVISPQMLDDVLAVLDDIEPQLAAEVRRSHESNPERTMELLRPHLPSVRRMMTIKSRDPRGYQFRVDDLRYARKTNELAKKIADAREAENDQQVRRLTREARELVSEHFDMRQAWRKHEVQLLERRVSQMRQAIDTRGQQKQQIIDDKLEEISGGVVSGDF